MYLMITGAVAMACVTACLFFLRFWITTKDRFFLFFAISFAIEAVGRVILGLQRYSDEQEPFFYLMRLFAFLVIIFAIIDKNWIRKKKTPLD